MLRGDMLTLHYVVQQLITGVLDCSKLDIIFDVTLVSQSEISHRCPAVWTDFVLLPVE